MSIRSTKQSKVDLEHLAALYELMINNQDEKNANKMLDLYEKKMKKEKIISFAGHFSAGKSSMINALMGEEILPKSPIPTSANIVKLTSGEGVARIYFHKDNPIEYNEPYDLSIIKDYCKDKDTISKIELSTTNDIIPKGSAIFDTPGIDAADDTDRLITESSLHLVDYMFYVVDYNHVQSEVNLQFLQAIQQMNIPYYLIINQIDKHNNQELSLSVFRKNIKQTFDQWQLQPLNIYFTSLVDYSGEDNQFIHLKDKVFSLLNNESGFLLGIENSVQQLVQNHKSFLSESLEEKINQLDLTNQYNVNDEKRLEELKTDIEKINHRPVEIESLFRTSLNHTLKNAYLMPASLRDKAKLFLESLQKDFKVGWLGSKKKTTIEKENRTKAFLNALQESIEANLKWKVRDKLHQLITDNNIDTPDLKQEIQHLQINYTVEDLMGLTKPGAKLNGDYVLNYTDNVNADVIQKYKQKINSILQMVHDITKQKWHKTLKEYKKKQNVLEKVVDDHKKVTTLQSSLNQKLTELSNQLFHPQVSKDLFDDLNEKIEDKYNLIKKADKLDKINNDSVSVKTQITKSRIKSENKQSAESIIQSIDKTIGIIDMLPGFESIISELEDKRERLINRKFTVTLFGAFSAGKSSFANALMGDQLLPTSPNPTTAVINKITAPVEIHKHGTVKIKLKDEITLLNDIKPIVKPVSKLTQEFTDLSSMVDWINKNKSQSSNHISKMHQSFLQALLEGYSDNKEKIGKYIEINMTSFADYVTDESKACYIEEVTLYYDCSITRKGITLVDTPGADSINARHTNVSFDYIKYADSILYVTYYNHALSRADKDFLQQLGRVKETFELDKMNFIINAADLAANQEEIDLVSNYVEDQLLKLGIRQPKIYPLSSKIALEELLRQKKNQQMATFKTDLFNFIEYELTGVITQSALYEINRAKHLLTNFIDAVNLDVQGKEQLRVNLLKSQEKMEEIIKHFSVNLYINRLVQKIDKQLYYVEDRISIRFHDMFKEKFNPTTINEAGRKANLQLENSMHQLLEYVGYELLQEVRAVSLRMEAFMRKLLQEANNDLMESLKEIEPNFTTPSISENDWKTPNYDIAFQELDADMFKKALAIFKGTKSFFVKNEKDIMKEAIYDTLVPFIKNYINDTQQKMNNSYSSQWQDVVENRKQGMTKDISSFVDNSLEMMGTTMNVADLKRKYTEIKKILS